MPVDPAAEARQGLGYALTAFTIWGFVPVYFVQVEFAEPLEVLAHRIVWTLPLTAILITLTQQWSALLALKRRQLTFLVASSVCLSINWLAFIWAIHDGKIVETSLGYFINPLVSIVLGWAILKEVMRPWQWIAVAIAAVAIVVELAVARLVPLFGLTLAFSFGLYGLLRRQVDLPSTVGFAVETAIMAPLAAGFLVYLAMQGGQRSLTEVGLLGLGGLVTLIPLIAFGAAAIRLPLTRLGIVQYLAPTISLLLAVFVYDEVVATLRWQTLGLVWVAILIFSIDGLRHHRVSNAE